MTEYDMVCISKSNISLINIDIWYMDFVTLPTYDATGMYFTYCVVLAWSHIVQFALQGHTVWCTCDSDTVFSLYLIIRCCQISWLPTLSLFVPK